MVTDLKYDPTGRMLALASADKSVYIYNASDGDYGAKAKCKGHKSVVRLSKNIHPSIHQTS